MATRTRLVLAALLVAVCAVSSANASCPNLNFTADTFVSKWNERVTADKLGPSWHLEKYNGLGFIRQILDDTSLLLTAKVDKSRCITVLEIKSRRADANGYAALVAWSSVIIVTNPSLPKEQRKSVFTALKLDKPDTGGSYSTNHVTYKYAENAETNDFSATPD
ncbi:MAG TPA: hypothetical protein VN982_03970 [Candidatus Dormibacteraeota bacterium]|nr:hypothetical protein [Candidatus Dormibacteraeota bacterium]